jgi:uncharacterized NAD(P)/FAD-binding protein YdhS
MQMKRKAPTLLSGWQQQCGSDGVVEVFTHNISKIPQCLQGSKVGKKEQQIGKIKECVVRAQVQAIVDMVTSTLCKAKVLEYQFAFLFTMLDNGNLSTQA